MSYRSHVAAPSRVFDHLYDPIFTTSDQKNVYKENCVALTRSAPIHVYPVYDSMFTELNYEERNCYAYQRNTLPFIASTKQQQQQERNISVTGVDRPKFFSNPISNIRTMNIGLMADKNAIESHDESQVKYKTTAMQTVYRESSAQTRAWLPECFTEEIIDDVPEVVYIADMIDSVTYPGLREIEIIERARKRRSWEMSLPPIKQADEIPSRVAALEAFEWEEWIAREKEINECQQARLKIVADLIAKREEKHKMSSNQKVENCKRRALEERNKQKEILM
ncbi:hypothetical protein PVAND_008837 [Polypedilum vanderplanki]|uniref:Cilia- and flagella-associated protein 91 n=1 Tax=Polypedilum vanderplanki TaxID=319348 RepID=A0A9J6CAU8_POLVA|nr:hypothetical protein PVAND_008837 [Polypedilum vanderplanki]